MKDSKKYFSPLFLLIGSYLILFFIWDLLVNSLLVPWDGTLPSDRPATGTIARDFNDFFEAGSGSLIPLSLILVIIGVLILIIRIKKDQKHAINAIEYTAITNMLYIPLAVLSDILIQSFITDIGYHISRSAVHLLFIIILFFAQYKNYRLHK